MPYVRGGGGGSYVDISHIFFIDAFLKWLVRQLKNKQPLFNAPLLSDSTRIWILIKLRILQLHFALFRITKEFSFLKPLTYESNVFITRFCWIYTSYSRKYSKEKRRTLTQIYSRFSNFFFSNMNENIRKYSRISGIRWNHKAAIADLWLKL